ncbi:MAG: hypothetical protein ABIR81_07670, partial [Ginsengibacter sp.]
ACTEISKTDYSTKTLDELQIDLGMAMMPSFQNHHEEIEKYFNVDFTDQKAMQQIGTQIGLKLATNCPAFLKLMRDKSSDLAGMSGAKPITSVGGIVSGTLSKIVPGEVTYFVVKSADGKMEKIFWMEYFKGAEKISSANISKPLKISYVEKDMYNSTLKDYIKQKVAVSVE